MDQWLTAIVTIVCSVLASSGFWALINSRSESKNAHTKALLGLLHDKIMTRGQEFINAGEISMDDYNDFFKYFYDPYRALDGNGTGERMANEIRKLPIKT